jgi:hypothetical protein
MGLCREWMCLRSLGLLRGADWGVKVGDFVIGWRECMGSVICRNESLAKIESL